jgi:hypothetical protein
VLEAGAFFPRPAREGAQTEMSGEVAAKRSKGVLFRRHPGCDATQSVASLVRDLSQRVGHADSDPVLAVHHFVLHSTRDDDDNTPRTFRQALAAGRSIRPFGPVRMKFNI